MQDYTHTITVKPPATRVISKILNVKEWWTKGVSGHAQKAGDKFTVRFGDTFVDFEITELIPGKKVVWAITDSCLHWVQNKDEWNGTKLIFSIKQTSKVTEVTMTHRGLVPKCECFSDCKEGWDFYFGKSFRSWLLENKGQPDGEKGDVK